MENGRPPRCGKCFARHDGKLSDGSAKKALTFSMTASSVVAAAATKPAKFQNIRRFASWNEEKTLFLFLFYFLFGRKTLFSGNTVIWQ